MLSGSQAEGEVTLKLGDDPRFQTLMKQKADLPKTARVTMASKDAGTL